MSVQPENTSLTIAALNVSDTGLYYCSSMAMSKLSFRNPTHLHVKGVNKTQVTENKVAGCSCSSVIFMLNAVFGSVVVILLGVLIFILLKHRNTHGDTHSLEFQYTALTPQYTGFPEFTAVGPLDGKQFTSYSSSARRLIPKDWIKNSNDKKYWKSESENMQGYHDDFNNMFTKIKNQFDHSREGHTLQRMYGCESDDDVITRRYDQYGFDGEDFISLNVENGTWIAVKPEALILKHNWKSNGYITYWKNFLKHKCVDWLKTFVTVEKKVLPKMSLFQKEASSPEVVCHATGFFPKSVTISWKKDGEDLHEDVDLRETLPNQDGSFQKRSILNVSAEELQKHTYTCVIEHSSLEKDLVLPVSERRILRDGGSGRGSDGGLIGIIVGMVVVIFVLVVLVILIWKKNSEFKPVPPRASSEGDSFLNNS